MPIPKKKKKKEAEEEEEETGWCRIKRKLSYN